MKRLQLWIQVIADYAFRSIAAIAIVWVLGWYFLPTAFQSSPVPLVLAGGMLLGVAILFAGLAIPDDRIIAIVPGKQE